MRILSFIISLSLIAGAICGCAPNVEQSKHLNFELDGQFVGMEGDVAFLKLITENGYEFVDSSRVAADGTFHLEAQISKPDFYILHFSDNNQQITIVPDTNQHISINGSRSDIANGYSIEGSPESEKICELVHKIATTRQICDSLGRIFRDNLSAPNLAGIKTKLDSVYNITVKSQREFSENFISDNPNSLAQIVCLSQYIAPKTPVFNPEKDVAIYNSVAMKLSELYPDNLHVRKLATYSEKLKLAQRGENQLFDKIKSGDPAREIALPNLKGDTIKLSSLKGKYIILDFWASWSDVAKNNSENLLKLYYKYYHNNIAVYQVSLDNDIEAWKQGVKNQKLSWISVSDLKVWNSVAVETYGIKSLPATYIIYPDFTIHEFNLTADKLDERLQKLLGKPIKKNVEAETNSQKSE